MNYIKISIKINDVCWVLFTRHCSFTHGFTELSEETKGVAKKISKKSGAISCHCIIARCVYDGVNLIKQLLVFLFHVWIANDYIASFFSCGFFHL